MRKVKISSLEKALILCADMWNCIGHNFHKVNEVFPFLSLKRRSLKHFNIKMVNDECGCAMCTYKVDHISFDCNKCQELLKWTEDYSYGDPCCQKDSPYTTETKENAFKIRDRAIKALEKYGRKRNDSQTKQKSSTLFHLPFMVLVS